MFTAVVVIGGIDYSAPFRVDDQKPRPKTNPAAVVGAVADSARAQAREDQTMEESLQALDDPEKMTAGAMVLDSDKQPKELGTRLFPTKMHCVVYGVMTDKRDVPSALLFAGNTIGVDQHIARIDAANIPPVDFHKIAVRLQSATRADSVVPSTFEAVWVEPDVMCRLTFDSVGEDGELVNPKFGGVIVNQPGRHR